MRIPGHTPIDTNGEEPIAKMLDRYEDAHNFVNGFVLHMLPSFVPETARKIATWVENTDTEDEKYSYETIREWLLENIEYEVLEPASEEDKVFQQYIHFTQFFYAYVDENDIDTEAIEAAENNSEHVEALFAYLNNPYAFTKEEIEDLLLMWKEAGTGDERE